MVSLGLPRVTDPPGVPATPGATVTEHHARKPAPRPGPGPVRFGVLAIAVVRLSSGVLGFLAQGMLWIFSIGPVLTIRRVLVGGLGPVAARNRSGTTIFVLVTPAGPGPIRRDAGSPRRAHDETMPIPTRAFAHVRLTVTDIDRSRAFYDDVFGLPVAFELPADADEETKQRLWFLFGGVIYQLGDSLLGLRPVSDDTFTEDRTGLDHVSFAVGSRADLDSATALLDSLSIDHDGVKDIGAGYIVEFRDPDNIALELFAPKE